jgi:hypothetical protein
MYDFADPDDPNTIRIPFIFVPHGHPLPTEWLRDHPGSLPSAGSDDVAERR